MRHFCHNYSIVKDGNHIQTFIECIDYEFRELKQCLDCYIGSRAVQIGEEQTDEWFTRLCAPKHRLVFARYQRWPFWPSKVIQWDEDSDDCWVQFFEPKLFTVALVPKDNIRDIDYKFESKQLTTDKIIPSMALLFKYLTNWRNQSSEDFKYESTYERLKKLLAKKFTKTVINAKIL